MVLYLCTVCSEGFILQFCGTCTAMAGSVLLLLSIARPLCPQPAVGFLMLLAVTGE